MVDFIDENVYSCVTHQCKNVKVDVRAPQMCTLHTNSFCWFIFLSGGTKGNYKFPLMYIINVYLTLLKAIFKVVYKKCIPLIKFLVKFKYVM